MIELSHSDLQHLESATGWCMLNSFLDANEELENIAPQASNPRFIVTVLLV